MKVSTVDEMRDLDRRAVEEYGIVEDLLMENGLDMDEILDLVLTTSLFGWANRLMHVLGDPMPSES